MKERLDSTIDDTLILEREKRKLEQNLHQMDFAEHREFYEDATGIEPRQLEIELKDKIDKISVLEYKIEKLERKKHTKEFRKRTGVNVRYGIMDIKNM